MNLKTTYLPVCLLSSLVCLLSAASTLDAEEPIFSLSGTRAPAGDPPAEGEAGGGSTTFAVPRLPFTLGSLMLSAASQEDRDAVDPWENADESWPESAGSPRSKGSRGSKGGPEFSAGFDFYGFPHTDFSFGDLDEHWDDAWRYELNICGYYEVSGHVEPYAGAYFYYEDKDWKEGNASLDNQVYGFGGEFGALLYALEKADKRIVNIPIVPFIRIGMGFNDGDFKNVPMGQDLYISGDLDSLRFEIAGGVDVRLVIARRIMVGIGAGVCYWNSFNVNGVSRNGVGVVVVSDDNADFEGWDTFARLTLSVLF